MSIENRIHRKAEPYVEALQTDDDHDTRDASPEPRPVGRPPIAGVTAEGHVHIRTTLHRKSAWVHAAKPLSLAAWATQHLDRAAKYQPE